MSKKISKKQFNRVEELYKQGYSDMSIERITGVSDCVIGRWRRERGLQSNYLIRCGMPYGREAFNVRQNFDGVFDYNKHLQAWFKEVGATSAAEKRYCLQIAAKEMIRLREGGVAWD